MEASVTKAYASSRALPIAGMVALTDHFFRNSQKATAEAAATLSESTL